MKPYVKTYLEYFGYDTSDWIPCEIPECPRKSVDLHHIHARSIRKDLENNISNLMALCREHHNQYGDRKQHREYLQNIHNEKMKNR